MDEFEDYAIKKVAKGGFVIFIGIMLSSILFFLYKVLAARYLGPAGYGLLTLGMTFLNIGALFGLAGLHHSIGKFVSHYLATKEYGKIKGILVSSLAITILSSAIMLMFLYGSSTFIEKEIFGIDGLGNIIKIFSLGIPFSVLTQLFKHYFFTLKKPEYAIISESVFEKLLNLIFLAFAISFSLPLFALSGFYVIALVVSSAIAAFLLKAGVSPIIIKGLARHMPDFRHLLSFSLPLMVTGILGAMLALTDTIFIGIFKSEADVGLYNAAYVIASALMLIWMSFGDMFYPVISELYAKKAKNSIRKTFEVISRWTFIIAFPVFIIVLTNPSAIITIIFGQSYQKAALPLSILIVGYFFITIFGLAEQGLRTFKKTKFLGLSTSLLFLINAGLDIALIPIFGIAGAAIATTLSLLMLSSIRLLRFQRLLKFTYDRTLYSRSIFSGIIALAIFFYGIRIFGLNMLSLIPSLIAYMAIYFALLVLFKSFSQEDIAVLEAFERKTGIKLGLIKKMLR